MPCPGFSGHSDGNEFTWNVEIWAQSLGWEDPLEEGMIIHSSMPKDRGAWWATVHGVTKSRTGLSD